MAIQQTSMDIEARIALAEYNMFGYRCRTGSSPWWAPRERAAKRDPNLRHYEAG